MRRTAGIKKTPARRSGRNVHAQADHHGAAGALALILLASQLGAQAQDYPNRTITIVVPLAAGSGMDALVRLYADKLQTSLGKPVIVENKPGAALMLAAQYTQSQPADGYT